MQQFILFKNDLKQILRDPIMGILLFAPVMIVLLFKLMVLFLFPFLQKLTGTDLLIFYPYLFSFVLLLISGMMGIVVGFLMIDDKDGHIAELMSVTPLGRGGYLINRLLLSGFFTFVYSIFAYYILGIVHVNLSIIVFLSLMQTLYTSIIGLLLFSLADNKVKGLTYAKGLNVVALFALTDLLALRWLTNLSWFFPSYWVTRVIMFPDSSLNLLIDFAVNSAWFAFLLIRYFRKQC